MNTKGVSGVIVTVLMVLLVIASVSIVWVVIRNLTKEITVAEGAADCFAVQLKIVDAYIEDADGDPLTSGNQLTINVKRVAGEGTIDEFKVYVEDDGGVTIGSASVTAQDLIPKVGETKKISITAGSFDLDEGKVLDPDAKKAKVAMIIGGKQCPGTVERAL